MMMLTGMYPPQEIKELKDGGLSFARIGHCGGVVFIETCM